MSIATLPVEFHILLTLKQGIFNLWIASFGFYFFAPGRTSRNIEGKPTFLPKLLEEKERWIEDSDSVRVKL